MKIEEWRDIPGFEGLYAVTSCGKVWSYKSKQFLKPVDNGHGYLKVCLYKNGKSKQAYLHRLTAEAYIPNPDNLPQVNHKDENKTHNYINNLEWISAKENTNYGAGIQKQISAREKAVYCIELEKEFKSITEAAKELGLHKSHISKCCRDIQKTTGSYHFNFVNQETFDKSSKQGIYCVELDRFFKSQLEAAEMLNISKHSINYCINGKQLTAGGYHWRRI